MAHYRQIRSKSGSLSSGEGGSLSPASYAHFGPAKVVYYVRRFHSNIDFGALKDEYKNNCVDDGYQISVVFSKEDKTKTIHISNYHQEDIAFAIELINKIVPDKYRIYYDREELIQSMENCDY